MSETPELKVMEFSENGLQVQDTLLGVNLTVVSQIEKHLLDTNLTENKEKKKSRQRKPKAQCKESLQSLDHTEILSALSLSDKPQGVGGNDKLNNLQRANQEYLSSASETSRPYDKSEDRLMNDRIASYGMNNFRNVSHYSLERAPMLRLRKKLLILDVNGLLADIVSPAPKESKADINILKRAVFKRPFCSDFLRFCFERFDVGIWSSRSKKVLDRMVDYLLGDMKHNLLLCWDMSHCTRTEYKTLENRHKSIVFKELRKIWEKSDPNLPWENGYYNESNTLLLDDSPYKALLNPAHTGIFPLSYSFKDGNDNLLGPGGDMRVYLESWASAENCKEYVAKHPFGQRGIDESSPLWAFYSNILYSQSNLSSKVSGVLQ